MPDTGRTDRFWGADVPRGTFNPSAKVHSIVESIPIELIRRGRFQPRQQFDIERLEELAESIRASGVIQPVLVRAIASDPADPGVNGRNSFELLAGERRWRAAQLAGLEAIPTIVRACTDTEAAVIALTENVQREDLNAIEIAESLSRLLSATDWTQAVLADRMGRSRSEIAHYLRLLKLPEEVRAVIAAGRLSFGHGKVLATLNAAEASGLARECERRHWTVAQLSRATGQAHPDNADAIEADRRELQRLERRIAEQLQTPTHLHWSGRRRRGTVTLDFHSLEALDGFLERLGIRNED